MQRVRRGTIAIEPVGRFRGFPVAGGLRVGVVGNLKLADR
jgi:hypothetical protein